MKSKIAHLLPIPTAHVNSGLNSCLLQTAKMASPIKILKFEGKRIQDLSFDLIVSQLIKCVKEDVNLVQDYSEAALSLIQILPSQTQFLDETFNVAGLYCNLSNILFIV